MKKLLSICGPGLLACLLPGLLSGGQTRTWSQGDLQDFEKGAIKNLSLSSDGRITLAPHLNDPSWLIADCRYNLKDEQWGYAQYVQNHITGAVFVHLGG